MATSALAGFAFFILAAPIQTFVMSGEWEDELAAGVDSRLIGETRKTDGSIVFGGTVGYCPQSAWMQVRSILRYCRLV